MSRAARSLHSRSARKHLTMSKRRPHELDLLKAYESGKLQPIATTAELQKMRAAAPNGRRARSS